ncbi:guanine nucleotide-binding protein subunit beta-like protein 1 [Histomonas meleagridis]|uniref:guanine nucleotide-binding protein subunit beta-like protein 1 n=1 Tax=Histomonas meleagridis TaxID=135588 RepID=UPI0035598AD3|nr:guanine nucleotide-binding protein subunit beta-like protein 1 [Histomonas meleagridis]KAH0799848.1 guanine nucleotide-binding protein subunit beta-like protein 1 [Histomonas meleagridis]
MQPPPPVAVLRGHKSSVTSLCFIPDRLISASSGCELFIWDIQSRRIISTLHKSEENDDGFLRAVANDKTIYVNSRLGRIFSYDMNGQLIKEISTGITAGFAGCRLQGTDLLFADAFNGRVYVYDTNQGTHFPILDYKNHGMIMDISVFNEYFSLALEDSTVVVYDSRNTAEPVWSHEMKLKDPIISLATVNENKCVVGSSQKEVYEVTPTGKSVFYEMPHAGVDDIAIRCDGRIWATAGWDGRVRLFDAKKKIPLAVLKHHRGGIHTVAFAQDGLLASGGDDRGIAIWSLYRK